MVANYLLAINCVNIDSHVTHVAIIYSFMLLV